MPGHTTRRETDSMGSIEVPADRYWGAQTERARTYFAIGMEPMPLEVIHALALVKKACAQANRELGALPLDKADLIVKAADEVSAGKLDAHFPLRVWTSGSGTQYNMNVNEVISNRAIEIAGGILGSKDPVHPNDDVNMSQSTNDAFPSAMHIATVVLVTTRLLPAVQNMRDALDKKALMWDSIVKIGRTHLQDAVPLTLGQEFSGYAAMLDEDAKRIRGALEDLYPLPLGGTVVGTGLNAPPGFDVLTAEKIGELTSLPFSTARNKFAVQGSHDALAAMSGAVKVLATSLYRIANDIRLLSSGPRAGIHELVVPANEPGSSIMPGKVNPTQCEAMAMVAVQAIALDSATSFANAGGSLEMNAYKPLIIRNVLDSVRLISDSCDCFTRYLLRDLEPDRSRIDRYVRESLMRVTALNPVIGYDRAGELVRYAIENGCSLEEANAALKFVPGEEFDRLVDPSAMVHPRKE